MSEAVLQRIAALEERRNGLERELDEVDEELWSAQRQLAQARDEAPREAERRRYEVRLAEVRAGRW